jgi:hypothetical protein
LTTLVLGLNTIGDEGAKALAEALKENSVLTTLILTSDSISKDLMVKFEEGVSP